MFCLLAWRIPNFLPQRGNTDLSSSLYPFLCPETFCSFNTKNRDFHQYYMGNLTGQLCVELLWHIFVFSLKSSSSPIRLPTSILLNTRSSCTCGRTLVSYINLLFPSILTSLPIKLHRNHRVKYKLELLLEELL